MLLLPFFLSGPPPAKSIKQRWCVGTRWRLVLVTSTSVPEPLFDRAAASSYEIRSVHFACSPPSAQVETHSIRTSACRIHQSRFTSTSRSLVLKLHMISRAPCNAYDGPAKVKYSQRCLQKGQSYTRLARLSRKKNQHCVLVYTRCGTGLAIFV